jgi:P27 family predicted phage terminase small subunit
MKGRKPTPVAIHLIRNDGGAKTLGRRPLPNVPQCTAELAEAPAWMSESQQEAWNLVIKTAPDGLLKNMDSSILTAWVVAQDLHAQAAVYLELCGMTTRGAFGQEIPSPYVGIMVKQAGIMMRAAAEMGFTPSSRSRVAVEKKPQGNAFTDLLGKKG